MAGRVGLGVAEGGPGEGVGVDEAAAVGGTVGGGVSVGGADAVTCGVGLGVGVAVAAATISSVKVVLWPTTPAMSTACATTW